MNFIVYFIKHDSAGVTWPWPWVTGEADEFMVRFFWDWVYIGYRVLYMYKMVCGTEMIIGFKR